MRFDKWISVDLGFLYFQDLLDFRVFLDLMELREILEIMVQ